MTQRIRFLPEHGLSGGALPWVISVMVFLCALAASAGFSARHVVDDWAAGLAQRISVQIVEPDADARANQADAVLDILTGTPGVDSARQLSRSEAERLLEPWLGVGNVTDDLPIPAMIDVTLKPGMSVNADALEARLQQAAPSAAVDDYARWLDSLNRLTNAVQMISLAVMGLIFAATAAIAVFGTRAGLGAHRESIEIMHLMGATDDTIAAEFRRSFLKQGLKGGLGGLAAAGAALALLMQAARDLDSGVLPSLSLGWAGWTLLALLPLFAGLLTMIAAHVTVRRALTRLP